MALGLDPRALCTVLRTNVRCPAKVREGPRPDVVGAYFNTYWRDVLVREVATMSATSLAPACSSQKRMSISRYIVVAVVRCSSRLLVLAGAPVELAEAEVAVGDERAHAARLGERQCLAVVGLAALGIEAVGMGRDVAEQVQRMGREPWSTRREFDRAVAQASRLVEPAEQQTGATQRVVGPARVA